MPNTPFVLIHGLGAHPDRWIFLKQRLKNETCLIPIIDHSVDSFEAYYRLLNHLIKNKVIIVAESMGGLIAWNFAARFPEKVEKLVLLSPAFKGNMKFSVLDYLKIVLQLNSPIRLPFTAEECTRDTEYQKVMSKNPKEIRTVRAKYMWMIFIEQIKARFLRPSCPTLTLISGKDELVDTRATRRIIKKDIKTYPQSHHALSIESNRQQVFDDMLQWLKREKS